MIRFLWLSMSFLRVPLNIHVCPLSKALAINTLALPKSIQKRLVSLSLTGTVLGVPDTETLKIRPEFYLELDKCNVVADSFCPKTI
ncbi:hypothetical protein [Vibrio taketomensis]|uniref:hypothetical protein n=1 Tax=Vibrio taketomensis TaxID=2572923 RepID=UPI00138A2C69|nr:hypothetical protein [Vibrio taketomensis]